MQDSNVQNTQNGVVAGRQLAVPELVGQVIQPGASLTAFLPTKGAQGAAAFLRATFPGTAPTVSVVATMSDHVTPMPGATAGSVTLSSGAWGKAPVSGLGGEDGCLLTITAAASSAVTIVGAEYTAL